MLNSLFPNIDWKEVEVIGFDLDGTLYDEFEFIFQVYSPISTKLASLVNKNEKMIYEQMLDRWLEKGSSYNRIFSEILEENDVEPDEIIIKELLSIFRTFKPKINLDSRVEYLLNLCASKYKLFITSNGGCELQTAKFRSLGLERWFDLKDVAISGCHPRKIEKPSIEISEMINVLEFYKNTPSKVVFFGDREMDRLYANNSGFQFAFVKNMTKVEGV